MLKYLFFIFGIIVLVSCGKSDRIDKQDKDYIYVWKYKGNDSTLVKYSQPRIVERKVCGGRHKNHKIYVDFNNDGFYQRCSLPTDGSVDRCETVRHAQYAQQTNKPIAGIFMEYFYPYHEYVFIRYK